MEGIARYCPDLVRWAQWCLGGKSFVRWGSRVIICSTGVQQGDPLAPLLFAVGLHSAIEEVREKLPELRELFFLDDGIFCDDFRRAMLLLRGNLARRGLFINPDKCELYGADGPLEGFDGIPIVPERDCWTYLGTPLCEQTGKAVEGPLKRVQQATAAISAFAGQYRI